MSPMELKECAERLKPKNGTMRMNEEYDRIIPEGEEQETVNLAGYQVAKAELVCPYARTGNNRVGK